MREISFESCSDTLYEEGRQITEEPQAEPLKQLCTNCTAFYDLTVSPNLICYDQVPVATQLYRGVILHNPLEMSIYAFSETENGYSLYLLADAVNVDGNWRYDYESTFQSYLYTVSGSIEFF